MRKDRKDHLSKLMKEQKEKGGPTFPIPWKDAHIYPVIIKVETQFLRYRLENGRTRRKQIEYLQRPGISKDLFNDPESDVAQKAQEEILMKMINDEGLKKDLKTYKQREPAVITSDGYILNGNRRLAALREMDKEYMDCVVLPNSATPKDLYRLELDLQMATPTIADYNWVDELLHIRYGFEKFGENKSTLSKKMRVSQQEITRRQRLLHLVDLYLQWLGETGHYFKVEGDEQVFTELEKFIRKLEDSEKIKVARDEIFGILKNPPEEGRLYNHVRKLFKNFEKIQYRIGGTVDVKKDEEPIQKEVKSTDDPLATLAQTTSELNEKSVFPSVSELFRNPSNAKENVENLIEVIQDVEAEEQEKKDRKAAYKSIARAQRELQSVVIDSTTLELKGIENKLKEIIRKSKDLLKRIDKTNQEKGNE